MGHQDDRIEAIFRCIVESYIQTASPIGSRSVSKMYEENLSPASIRNVMADLEEMGYITQPHTSAGRIPTVDGYRHYVNSLMSDSRWQDDDQAEDVHADEAFSEDADIESVAESLTRILAETTHSPSICFVRGIKRVSFLSELNQALSEAKEAALQELSRLYIEGTSHMFEHPEFTDLERLHSIMRALELKQNLVSFLEREIQKTSTKVYIGSEIDCDGLEDVSLVAKPYYLNGRPMGCLAVVGPTRMNYAKVVRVVDRIADEFTDYLDNL